MRFSLSRYASLDGHSNKDDESSHSSTNRGRDVAHKRMFNKVDIGKSDDYGLITRYPIHWFTGLSETRGLCVFAYILR